MVFKAFLFLSFMPMLDRHQYGEHAVPLHNISRFFTEFILFDIEKNIQKAKKNFFLILKTREVFWSYPFVERILNCQTRSRVYELGFLLIFHPKI